MASPPHEPVLRALLDGFEAVSEIEWIPLAESLGRVLAHPVRSRATTGSDEVLIASGSVLDGPRLAWLAELGLEEVDVVRCPRVAVLRDEPERSDPWTALLLALSRQVGASAVRAAWREGWAGSLPRAARSHEATLVPAAMGRLAPDLGRKIELSLEDWGLEAGWALHVTTGIVFGVPAAAREAWVFFEALVRPWLEQSAGNSTASPWEAAHLASSPESVGFALARWGPEGLTPLSDLPSARLEANVLVWLPADCQVGDAVPVRRLAGR